LVRVSSRILRDGLPDDNNRTSPLLDDGASAADPTAGDVTAGDGLFTSPGIYTDCCAVVGPRTVRIKAETLAADGLRHATAVDVEPFAVVANPGDVPTPVPPTAIPPTATSIPPTTTPVPPTATSIPPTETPLPPTASPMPPTPTPAVAECSCEELATAQATIAAQATRIAELESVLAQAAALAGGAVSTSTPTP
jgi:hypothetical protein